METAAAATITQLSAAMGKLDPKQFIEAVALVLAYLAPSPVLADVSKKAGE